MARGGCLVLSGLLEKWGSLEKRGIEEKQAIPGRQGNRGRWVTLEYLERGGHLGCKGSQGLLVAADPSASEDPKAGGVRGVLTAHWGRKGLLE